MVIPHKYIDLRNNVNLSSVSLGYSEVYLFKENELKKGQIGYSVDTVGNSLIANDDGSWGENWLVIGYEDCCGDPIFIDVLSKYYSVYTAMHGEGEWSPIMISDTYEMFIQSLSYICDVTKGRENPVSLEKNPILKSEKDKIVEHIRLDNPNSEIFFWENFLEQ